MFILHTFFTRLLRVRGSNDAEALFALGSNCHLSTLYFANQHREKAVQTMRLQKTKPPRLRWWPRRLALLQG